MFISLAELKTFLALEASLETHRVRHEDKGPGQLDKWSTLVEGKKKSFIRRESTPASFRKKLIFSNALLADEAPDDFDLSFISVLINKFDVIFLPHEETDISTLRAITSTRDFWRELSKVKAATKTKIKTLLAQQGLAAEDYVIVDYEAYATAKKLRKSKTTAALEEFNLENYNLNDAATLTRLQNSLDPQTKIKQITTHACTFEEFKWINNQFQYATAIYIQNISNAWHKANDAFFAKGEKTYQYHLESAEKYVNVFKSSAEKINMQALNLPESKNKDTANKKKLLLDVENIFRFNQHREFNIYDSTRNIIDVRLLDKLEELTIYQTDPIEELKISPHQHITDLCIIGPYQSLKKLETDCLPFLTHLTLTGSSDLKVDFTLLKSLIDLELKNFQDRDLSSLTNLEKLRLNNYSGNLIIPDAKKLKHLSLAECSNIDPLDLKQFPELEELEISQSDLTTLDFSGCPHLKRLKIRGNFSDLKADFTQLKNLESLEVSGIMEDTAILPPGLLDAIPHLSNLKKLSLTLPEDTYSLNFSPCKELENIELAGDGNYKIICAENLPKLKHLEISGGTCEEIKVNHDARLHTLIVKAQTSHLETKECPRLRILSISNDEFTASYLDECRKLSLEDSALTVETETKIHATTFMRLDNEIKPDIKTNQDEGFFAKQSNIKVTLEEKYQPDSDYYRMVFFNEVSFDEKTEDLKFKFQPYQPLTLITQHTSTWDDELLLNLQKQILSDEKAGLGHLSGELHPQIEYDLPTQQFQLYPPPIEVYTQPPESVEVYYDVEYGAYKVKLKEHLPATPVEILYKYPRNLSYAIASSGTPISVGRSILSPHLTKAIDAELKHFPPLQFLHNPDLTIATKLRQLDHYCKTFANEAIHLEKNQTEDSLSDLQKCLLTIKQQKGACAHRSKAFMLLASWIGVSVHMVGSADHAYCEIKYPDGYKRFDFGGASSYVDLVPESERTSIFDRTRPPEITISPPSAPVISLEEQKWEEDYTQYIAQFVEKKSVKTADELLTQKIQNPASFWPLIELTGNQDPLLVKKQLLAQLRERKDVQNNYLYIHSPEDFKLFLRPYRFEKGQRTQVDGPLMNLLSNGGALLINWSEFTAREIARFKSILDEIPTLMGFPVSPQLKIIGFMTPHTESCTAFTSRCTPYTLHDDFFTAKASAEKKPVAEKKIEVDLFSRPDWRDYLLGTIIFAGNQIHLADGPLLQAIKTGALLHIHNPPPDPQLNLLMKRALEEGRILYNGEYIAAHPNFNIVTDTLEFTPQKKTLENISFVKEEEKSDSPSQKIFLSLHNLHECIEFIKVDNTTQQAKTEPGLLAHFNEKQDIFYVTESLNKFDWKILLSHMEKNFLDKRYKFMLAPGVQIEGVQKNDSPPRKTAMTKQSLLKHTPSTIITNDPDFLSEELQEHYQDEKPLLIDVSEETLLQDLIAKLTITQQEKNPGQINFNLQEQGMLQALREGRTVILNGELSASLYNQLLPLLSSPPHFYLNGERIQINGRLIAVMPPSSKKNISLDHFTESHYTANDYENALPREDKEHFESIIRFFDLAKRISHRGGGLPSLPTLSFHRLQRMIRLLKNPRLHAHNPIKGLFLYDYPKKSEEYAYLNVAAKLLFRPTASESNPAKLRRLFSHYHITRDNFSEHVWKILNCLSNSNLTRFLSPLEESLEQTSGFPKLTANVLSELWENITSILTLNKKQDLEEKKEFHVDKRQRQVNTLLEAKDCPILMLKGEAGVGKTFTIRRVLGNAPNVMLHEGENAIETWLKGHPPEKRHILLLDEANLAKPGTWNFLKGISRKIKSVYYKGQNYLLSDNHRIMLTGNPENYPGRFYHEFFQHYAETLHFKMPEDTYLEKQVLEPHLMSSLDRDQRLQLIKAFHLIQQHHPTYLFSTRDLENLTERVNVLLHDTHDTRPTHEIIFYACVVEFAGTLPSLEKRKAYITALRRELGILYKEEKENKGLVKVSETLFVPEENIYVINAIEQAVQIRESALAKDEKTASIPHKQGLLIEGDPGVGKSTLIRAILEQKGFSEKNPDTQKKYYVLNAGDDNTATLLLKAFREGSVVILDELNVDPDIEKLLNQLLTGNDPETNAPPAKRGFMVFASQNASHQVGRVAVSKALRNRLHFMYMNSYSDNALAELAKQFKVEHPKQYASAYHKVPGASLRTFFTSLKRHPEEQFWRPDRPSI